MAIKRGIGLGRGLHQLLGEVGHAVPLNAEGSAGDDIQWLPLSSFIPNRNQPRKYFDQGALEDLAQSIRQKGLLQPILVRPQEDGRYEIVAGERRWRAAQMIELEKIPAFIRDLSREESAELALIENLQREDLSPVEEARGYEHLLAVLGCSQEDLASRVGKSRSHISNMMRLLKLPTSILEKLQNREIGMGHARSLLSAEDPEKLAQRLLSESMTVRDIEEAVRGERVQKKGSREASPAKAARFYAIEKDLSRQIGLAIKIVPSRKKEGKGSLHILYPSEEHFQQIVRLLSGGNAGVSWPSPASVAAPAAANLSSGDQRAADSASLRRAEENLPPQYQLVSRPQEDSQATNAPPPSPDGGGKFPHGGFQTVRRNIRTMESQAGVYDSASIKGEALPEEESPPVQADGNQTAAAAAFMSSRKLTMVPAQAFPSIQGFAMNRGDSVDLSAADTRIRAPLSEEAPSTAGIEEEQWLSVRQVVPTASPSEAFRIAGESAVSSEQKDGALAAQRLSLTGGQTVVKDPADGESSPGTFKIERLVAAESEEPVDLPEEDAEEEEQGPSAEEIAFWAESDAKAGPASAREMSLGQEEADLSESDPQFQRAALVLEKKFDESFRDTGQPAGIEREFQAMSDLEKSFAEGVKGDGSLAIDALKMQEKILKDLGSSPEDKVTVEEEEVEDPIERLNDLLRQSKNRHKKTKN